MGCHASKENGRKEIQYGFKLTLHSDVLDYPLSLKVPRMIFVNSMSDLFHNDISFEFIEKVFGVMKNASWHQYQILTKRNERLREFGNYYSPKSVEVFLVVVRKQS
jgi:protein gp37